MEDREDDALLISGIQHFAFCCRQWALIHIEQQWTDNVHTVSGHLLHNRAHDKTLTEKRDYYERRHTPRVKPRKVCASCSLKDLCVPKLPQKGRVAVYIQNALSEDGCA